VWTATNQSRSDGISNKTHTRSGNAQYLCNTVSETESSWPHVSYNNSICCLFCSSFARTPEASNNRFSDAYTSHKSPASWWCTLIRSHQQVSFLVFNRCFLTPDFSMTTSFSAVWSTLFALCVEYTMNPTWNLF